MGLSVRVRLSTAYLWSWTRRDSCTLGPKVSNIHIVLGPKVSPGHVLQACNVSITYILGAADVEGQGS